MFGDHTYLSGVTHSLGEHFRKVAVEVDERFFQEVEGPSVLDIGSNDGTQLRHFQSLGYDVQGVESSRTAARIATAAGVPTLNEFFNLDCRRAGSGGNSHVVNAAGGVSSRRTSFRHPKASGRACARTGSLSSSFCT